MDWAGLVKRLADARLTLAFAESCTGGLLGAHVTAVPGSSAVFQGAIVAYNDRVKGELLGVADTLLAATGAVSAAAVEAMAHGARSRLGADVAVAVSGIAGPRGGSQNKPIGTVWLAVVGPGDLMHVERVHVPGDRDAVRAGAVVAAYRLVIRALDEFSRTPA